MVVWALVALVVLPAVTIATRVLFGWAKALPPGEAAEYLRDELGTEVDDSQVIPIRRRHRGASAGSPRASTAGDLLERRDPGDLRVGTEFGQFGFPALEIDVEEVERGVVDDE